MPLNNQNKIKDINESLKEILLRHLEKPDVRASAISGLSLSRRESGGGAVNCFEKPLACVIVQGCKNSRTGSSEFFLRPNSCLVLGARLPSSSRIVQPSPENPFLALFFYLDRKMLSDLALELDPMEDNPVSGSSNVSAADSDPEFLETVLRLAELLDKPKQIAGRAPIIMRELHYLLLIGPQRGALRELLAAGRQREQISHALSLMKRSIAEPLRMDVIAKQSGMSVSTMHRYFKNMTGFSPLQYFKHLRLNEAQRLMLVENETASRAAFSVGYESAAQFNREYKRMFGEPPLRDMNRRKSQG